MSKIKLSDFIAKRLKEKYNIKHCFMITGGGAMHLNDSLGKYVPYICNHNEQASAIAAEGYARVNQELAVVNVTTGPGGLNCLNGVFGQWTDSVPVLYISGQVKYSTSMDSCKEPALRQLGDQEADIISVVKPLTKYAATVFEPKEIKYHLDRAIYEATTGRFGPVWLNIPINVQSAMIDENELVEFIPGIQCVRELDTTIEKVIEKLSQAKRPLIVAGHGIRLSKQINNFNKLIKKLNIPVVTTFNGMDLAEEDNPLFIGRIGTVGQRAGNFALQNADLLLELGTRNNIRQVSYNWENFGKNAFKIIVDIDKAELEKPLVKPDLAVNADLKDFMPALLNKLGITPHPNPLPQGERKVENSVFCSSLSFNRTGEGQSENSETFSSPLEGEDVRRTGEGNDNSHRIYMPYIKTLARTLRQKQTPQEMKIWSLLRNSQTGYKFRRQHQFNNKYIADFVCLEKHLIIELDGSQHIESFNDTQRTFYLNSIGFDVIRFWNNEVDNNLEGCYEVILEELNTPHPSPLPQGEREEENSHNHCFSKNNTQLLLSAEFQEGMEVENYHSELVSESLDKNWLEFCKKLKEKYSFKNEKYYIQEENQPLNPYYFIRKLTENLNEGNVFLMSNGSACVCPFQVSKVKEKQRYILNSGDASMGYGLPAAIGACIANNKKSVICIEGDGSIMMNLQELQTVKHYNLPLKIFVINNDGYISIKQTHNNFFEGHKTGCSRESGVSTPDFEKIAKAFGIEYVKIENTYSAGADYRKNDVKSFSSPLEGEDVRRTGEGQSENSDTFSSPLEGEDVRRTGEGWSENSDTFSSPLEGEDVRRTGEGCLDNLDKQIQRVLDYDGAILCEVVVNPDYIFIPKLSARKLDDGTMISPSLEDMYPFLDRKEYEENILFKTSE